MIPDIDGSGFTICYVSAKYIWWRLVKFRLVRLILIVTYP